MFPNILVGFLFLITSKDYRETVNCRGKNHKENKRWKNVDNDGIKMFQARPILMQARSINCLKLSKNKKVTHKCLSSDLIRQKN